MSTAPATVPPTATTEARQPSPITVNAGTGETITEIEPSKPGQHSYLLCLDPADTEASKRALEYTKNRLALPGDYVLLLSVLPSRVMDAAGAPIGTSPDFLNEGEWYFEDQWKQHEARKERELTRLHAAAAGFKEGVKVHIRIAYGEPITQIIEARDAHKSDMVIVGRRKMGRVKRWLSSGSVSTALLTNSDCSVLVVR